MTRVQVSNVDLLMPVAFGEYDAACSALKIRTFRGLIALIVAMARHIFRLDGSDARNHIVTITLFIKGVLLRFGAGDDGA